MTLQTYRTLTPQELAKTVSVHFGDVDTEQFKALVENSKPILTTHNSDSGMSAMICEEGIYVAYDKAPSTPQEQQKFRQGLDGLIYQLMNQREVKNVGSISNLPGDENGYTKEQFEAEYGDHLAELDATVNQVVNALLAQSPAVLGSEIPSKYALFGVGEQSGGAGE